MKKCKECGQEVEEDKSLEDKFRCVEPFGTPQEDGRYHTTHDADYHKLAKIAKDHYLEVFDKVMEELGKRTEGFHKPSYIRKALEEG